MAEVSNDDAYIEELTRAFIITNDIIEILMISLKVSAKETDRDNAAKIALDAFDYAEKRGLEFKQTTDRAEALLSKPVPRAS